MASTIKQIDISRSLPPVSEISEQFQHALKYWLPRNQYIRDMRDALAGKRPIKAPSNLQYKIRVLHTYLIASMLNEKTSRYLDNPVPQVVVENPLDSHSREKSTRIERALYAGQYEMERIGDGDVWSRLVSDAILLDGGCERIECFPNSAWPELSSDKPMDGELREYYKQNKGYPIRSVYVPLEFVLPIYDGTVPSIVFELETRSLWSCLRNPLYNKSAFEDFPSGTGGGIDIQVPIIHYCNGEYHAYFVMRPGSTYDNLSGLPINPLTLNSTGDFGYLYGYPHKIGRPIYNFVAGRYGGWKTQNNKIEGVGKALLELSDAADEVISQVLTNIRAKYWPTLVHKVNPELRAITTGGGNPPPPQIKEGESITLYLGEELDPLFSPKEDPTIPWIMDQIKEQLGKLGGSSTLFGVNQPGVDTGYHNAQQISQSEKLDEKIEQHLAMGAIERFTIQSLYIRDNIGEKVWTHYKERESGHNKKSGEYLFVDPDDLYPLPRFDVKVRRPKPIDTMTAIRAFREATDDRGGKGPILSDDTAHEMLLGTEAPDLELKKRIIEGERNKLLQSNIIAEKIGEAINLTLARQGTPSVTPEMLGKLDPALLQALQQRVAGGQSPPPGGIDPRMLEGLMNQAGVGGPPQMGPPQGLGTTGGMLPTDPQMEARIGEAIAGAQQVG